MARILEMAVLAQLQEEAPKVIVPSYAAHMGIVRALAMWASTHPVNGTDETGRSYWVAALHDLLPLTGFPELTPKQIGSVCRSFCLVMNREGDGFTVAYSQKQLEILRKSFGITGGQA